MNAPMKTLLAEPLFEADHRRTLWLILLIASGIATSFGFACATPFAGIAAVSALTLRTRDAFFVNGAVWFANQCVGFAFLDYPWTANCIAWGFGLAVATALATGMAAGLAHRLGRSGVIAPLTAFVGAFVAYEGALYFLAAAWLRGTESFEAAIVGRVAEINAAAFVGMLGLYRFVAVRKSVPAAISSKAVMLGGRVRQA